LSAKPLGENAAVTTARIIVLLLMALVWAPAANAAGPVETSVFAVTGVDVDVTDTNATTARTKAIIQAQVKAFHMLAERLGGEGASAKFADLTEKDIGRMLRSLSIEEEHTGPGRYIGKLTVRFLPAKIRPLFSRYGIAVVEDQAPPVVVLPVWKSAEGPLLWEDNPWRRAWIGLNAQQSIVPVIVPLGDLVDTGAISAAQALAQETPRLEGLQLRYDAKAILVAVAEPAEGGGIHATMVGDTPIGRVTFDKVYASEDGSIEGSAALAAQRFHAVMAEKWRATRAKAIAEAQAREAARLAAEQGGGLRSMSVAVPFSGAGEWNAIRERLLSTPGVTRVDISTIAGNGALIELGYASGLQNLQTALLGAGLQLRQVGGTWVLQPL
jgi:hypothetical protein